MFAAREKGLEKYVPAFLKITAIGTIADIMKLHGENRAIVSIGLKGSAEDDESRA